uniref:SPNS lysolipid transporter 2, sphingosine-1-phosphate n=1 Tax=Lynx canadensis TaxID=61383 RepID=A0A667HZX7_LYNCA
MLGSAVLQLTGNWRWALRLELCVVHPWGDCHRLCDWSSGLLGPQISVRGPCGAWTAAPLPPGAVRQPGQPDFWGVDCRDGHHWSCPGSRGFQEVQESQSSGRAPPLRWQPSDRSPLPLPGSHPGPDHVPGLLCVLLDIQQQFGVKDRGAGLLQSVFICSFMVAAPIFGYLGDRFNRKVILSCGVFFWSAVTFSSSFIPRQHFWLLVLSRGLVGIGEASYSTIAPTIIGDLFTKNTRTLMLSVFYFAIPLGSGLGYITGSSVKQAAGDWRWALRVSPIVGMITGTLILILVPATKRGHADQFGGQLKVRTSWLRDMKALIRNRSYVFSSLATSAVSFATGALGMWIPLYLHRAQVVQKTADTCSSPPCGAKDSLIFGAITCFTGFLGVVTGAGATRWCRLRTQRADPLVCAVGMLGSAIFVCLIFVAAKSSIVGAYVCIFVGETLLFSNWAITADILMYVVIPTRRATAVALQSFTSHLLGDAGSPYLIGFISDLIRQSTKDSPLWEFLSLGYALMLCPFVVVLGGMFFLATALFFLGDRAKAEQQVNQLVMPPAPVKV